MQAAVWEGVEREESVEGSAMAEVGGLEAWDPAANGRSRSRLPT